MVTLHIRPLTRRDVIQVRSIDEATSGVAMFSSKLAGWLGQQNHTAVCAEADGRIAGYLAYRFDVGTWLLVLEHLAVHPSERRRGVGRRLLSQVLDACRTLEGSRIQASVAESDVGLQLFFKSAGFRAVRIVNDTEAGNSTYLFEYTDVAETSAASPEGTRPQRSA